MRGCWKLFALLVAVSWMGSAAADRPNILWLSAEDMGPHLGCYGDPHARTPTLDALAAEGLRYTHAFTVAPVCAPNRAAVITGMYPWAIGAHHMRTGGEGASPTTLPVLPEDVKLLPQLLRAAGYYCTNNSKEDYNFAKPKEVWDESSGRAHWRNRPEPDQPFFAVFNYTGTHEGQVRADDKGRTYITEGLKEEDRADPAAITPPPYHPDTPVVRRQWANYYDGIAALDQWADALLRELNEDGLGDETIVVFWSDHGAGLPRCKRWPYDSGTRIPLILRIPEQYRGEQATPGTVNNRLVSSIDLAPTMLAFAGLAPGSRMQGRDFLDDATASLVFSGRDRMDERYDLIRSVRDGRFRYVRHFMPWKPYDQYMEYEEQSPVKQELHRLKAAGELTPATAWVAATSKPVEELYDLEADPHELNNLATKAEIAERLSAMRNALAQWSRDAGDMGLIPEAELWRLQREMTPRADLMRALEERSPGFQKTLWRAAMLAAEPASAEAGELDALSQSPEPSVRYWTVLALRDSDTLAGYIKDASPLVALTAAALCLERDLAIEESLAVIRAALGGKDPWLRLLAVQALEAAPRHATGLIDDLAKAREDRESKYVVRAATRLHAMMMEN
ncbi:MAG: hypothetical protein RLZZ303_582 [Candidatus Hydrogenedentota bacterium]|jgi:uncharacterized sulfatase